MHTYIPNRVMPSISPLEVMTSESKLRCLRSTVIPCAVMMYLCMYVCMYDEFVYYY